MSDPLVLDTSGDYLPLELDGVKAEIDLLAAYQAFGQIDFEHRDDTWYCYACQSVAAIDPLAEVKVCPTCHARHPHVQRDPVYLDDVARWLKEHLPSVPRISRRAAGAVYSAVCNAWDQQKKSEETTPESLTGTA